MEKEIPSPDFETGNHLESKDENVPLVLDDGDWPECPNCHHKGKRWFGLCPECGAADNTETEAAHTLLPTENGTAIKMTTPDHEADFKALDASIDSLLSELLELEVHERNMVDDTIIVESDTHEKLISEKKTKGSPITPKVRTTLEWVLLSVLLLALLVLGISAGLWAYVFFFH